ncbi:hypothetical protein PspLS_05330 [Pyricularia sp. CBS 133598]|nr:hypothetical protein PspLS_05330 [Pyricularia sp. CBS 133598]
MACLCVPKNESILLALGKGRAMTGMYESRGTVPASQLSCVRGVALWTGKKCREEEGVGKGACVCACVCCVCVDACDKWA